jgi:hypothetical protein
VRETNAYCLANNQSSKECHSWKEETKLFGCPVAGCLGNAAESLEQALDAMADRYGRMATAACQLRAGDTFELELSQ